jgi:hypothetical protein
VQDWTAAGEARSLSSSDREPNQESIVDEESELVVTPDSSAPSKTEAPSPPALSDAEQQAMQIIAALDVIASHMSLEKPDRKTARRARGSRTVSPEFVSSMIAAVEALPKLQTFPSLTTRKAREVLQSKDPFRIVGERIAMLQASVNYTMQVRWAEVVSEALATFRMADALAELPENADIAAHVETLRRHLGRTNKAKRKKTKTAKKTTKT